MRRLRQVVAGLVLVLAVAPLRGDQAALLLDEKSAAAARLRLALDARRSLDVSTFILGDEPFSLVSVAILRATARRGVRVRLLVDAQWDRLPRPVAAHLLAEGVEIRRYHPFRLLHPLWLTRRLHDKLIVADGEELIAGGRNIESPYFGLGRQLERHDYIDSDIAVRGAAAKTAADYFHAVWSSRHVRPSRARANPVEMARAAAQLDDYALWFDRRLALAAERGETAPPLAEVGPVQFLHDPPGGKARGAGVGAALRVLLEETKREALIETPYLVPTRAARSALAAAVERGVRVRILTNSPATTDNLWPQAAYAAVKKKLLGDGLELWEYVGSDTLHAKTAVFDGKLVVVGSYNLDPRSERLNTELAVVVENEVMARALAAEMDAHLENAVQIGPDGRPLSGAVAYPKLPWGKRWKLRLLRLVVPLFRGQT